MTDLQLQVLLAKQRQDITFSQQFSNPYGATGANSAAKAGDATQSNIINNPLTSAAPESGSSSSGGTSASSIHANAYMNAVHANGISDALSGIKSKASSAIQNATNAAANVTGAISKATSAISSATSAISNATSAISNGLSGLGGLGDKAKELGSKQLENILGGATEKLESGLKEVQNKAAMIPQAVRDPRSLTSTAINTKLGTVINAGEDLLNRGVRTSPGSLGKNQVAGAEDEASASDNSESGEDIQQSTNEQADTQIMSPILFTAGGNWCGLNYGMLNGARTMTQKMANGRYVVTGCMSQDHSSISPILKPGAICIKGFGDNMIHWHSSDLLEIKVGSEKGSNDFNTNLGGQKPNADARQTENGSSMFINLDGHDESITISVTGTKDQKTSTIIIQGDTVTVNTTHFIVNAEEDATIDAKKTITLKAGEKIKLEANDIEMKGGSSASASGSGSITMEAAGTAAALGAGGMTQDASKVKHNFPVKIADDIKKKIGDLKDKVNSIKEEATGALQEGMNAAKDAMGQVKNAAAQAQSAVSQATAAAGNIGNAVSQQAGAIKGAVSNAAGGIAGKVSDFAKNNPVSSGIKEKAGGLLGQAKDVISNVKNTISSVKKTVDNVKQIANTAISTVSNITSKVSSKEDESLGKQYIERFKTKYKVFGNDDDTADETATNLSNGEYELLSDVAEIVGDNIDMLADDFDNIESTNEKLDNLDGMSDNTYDMAQAIVDAAIELETKMVNNTISVAEAYEALDNINAMTELANSEIDNTLLRSETLQKEYAKLGKTLDEHIDVLNEANDLISSVNDDIDEAMETINQELAAIEEAANQPTELQSSNYRIREKAIQLVKDYNNDNISTTDETAENISIKIDYNNDKYYDGGL